jgi:hypothetical protein
VGALSGGGLQAVRKARILVAEADWYQISGRGPKLRGCVPLHIDLPELDWRLRSRCQNLGVSEIVHVRIVSAAP